MRNLLGVALLASGVGCAHAPLDGVVPLPKLALNASAVRQRHRNSAPRTDVRSVGWGFAWLATLTFEASPVPRPRVPRRAVSVASASLSPPCASAVLCRWERNARREALRDVLARLSGDGRAAPPPTPDAAWGGSP